MTRRGSGALLACALLMAAGSLWHARAGYFHEDLSGHAQGSDDAYISFRYARNLWAGHGLVFNPGERVEGYSNLLHVVLLAPAFPLLGEEGVYAWSVALNLGFALGALVVHHLHLRRRLDARRAALGSLLFALCPTVWLWVASGLETALVLLVQIALWALTERAVDGPPGDEPRPSHRGGVPHALLPLVTVVSVLARADGFVAPAVAVAYLFARRARRAAAVTAAALASSLGAVMAWRLAYYGHPWPNTYYAKVAGPLAERLGEALLQLRDLALGAGLLPYLLALALAPVLFRRRQPFDRQAALPFETVFAVVWLGYWLYVGGDVFGERFLIVLVPLGAAAMLEPLARPRPAWRAAVVAVTLAFQLWPLVGDRRFRYSLNRYDRWIELGRLLAPEAARGATLAVCAAGKVPYYSRLTTIDMLGLTDATIAHRPATRFRVGHSKYDPDYVLARRPDMLATWIDTDLNLRWGLDRSRWEGAGYRLKYLVYTRRRPAGWPILDASRLDAATAADRVRAGYQYAVLEKESRR